MFPLLLSAACAAQAGHLTCQTQTDAGKTVTMTFTASNLTHSPSTAYDATICASPAKPVTLAKLWMPEHGHGSARTRLAAAGNCTKVTRMVFTMAGAWDVQVTFQDNDKGVIHVPVR